MTTLDELREQLKDNATPLNKLLVGLIEQNSIIGDLLKQHETKIEELEIMVKILDRRTDK